MRSVVPKFQSSRLNGVATIALTYIDTYIQTSCRTYVIPKKKFFFAVIDNNRVSPSYTRGEGGEVLNY